MKNKMVCDVLGGSCVSGMFYISNSKDHKLVEQKNTEIITYLFGCLQVKMAFEEAHFKEFKSISFLSFISLQ